jgi:PleD family two-component response regulator
VDEIKLDEIDDITFDDQGQEEEAIQRKIFYVDDINFHLLDVRERLHNHYEVYPVQSAERMFELLERVVPDIILLDINMPEVNGFEAIMTLKAEPRYADIPVIFLTSQKDKKIIAKGMKLGAADFITRPYTNEQLIECIEYQFDSERRAAVRPSILAIDDTPSILQAVNAILGERYTVYTLHEVKHEQVIIELLKKITPDLFLLDYNMPGLTGFDLVPIIRRTHGHEETPIVFLTSDGSVDHVMVARHLGACDYIIKPIDKSILHARMEKHLADFIMRRRIRALTDERRRP